MRVGGRQMVAVGDGLDRYCRSLVPQGWKAEVMVGRPNCTVIIATGTYRGSVSIDFTRRGFRSGYSFTGPLASTKKYAGRGWKADLVKDAIDHLYG